MNLVFHSKFNKFLILALSLSFFWSADTHARLNPRQMKKLEMPMRISKNDELETLSTKMIPQSLVATDSSRTAVSKIIDQSLSYWWTQSEFKNTAIGQTAAKVENKLKVEADLGNFGSKSQVDHKISLKLMAAQALAKFEYRGWVQAALNFDLKAARTETQLIENLDNHKDLIISHSTTAEEKQSKLSLRWDW